MNITNLKQLNNFLEDIEPRLDLDDAIYVRDTLEIYYKAQFSKLEYVLTKAGLLSDEVNLALTFLQKERAKTTKEIKGIDRTAQRKDWPASEYYIEVRLAFHELTKRVRWIFDRIRKEISDASTRTLAEVEEIIINCGETLAPDI